MKTSVPIQLTGSDAPLSERLKARALAQFAVLRVRNGQAVAAETLQRLSQNGYVLIRGDGIAVVTHEGQIFLGHA